KCRFTCSGASRIPELGTRVPAVAGDSELGTRNSELGTLLVDTEHLPHGREREVAEQPPQPALSRAQVDVVSESNPPGKRNARVIGVDLPRMEVEDGGLSRAVDGAEG